MYRKMLGAAMALLLCLLAVGCGGQSDKVPVRIGFQVIPNTEAVVKSNGWLEKSMKQAAVQWLSFDSGRDVNTALTSGSIDIGLLGSTLVATGISKGLDYKVIWLADVIGANEALAVKTSSGIRSLKDLKGKTVAVTFGSTTQYTLLGALKSENVDPKDVKIIDMRPPEMLAAWKRGDIDAGYLWQPTLQQMVADGGSVLLTSGDLVAKGIVTADVIVVRSEFASKHPDLVISYIAAQMQAVKLYRDNPQQAAADVARLFSIKPDEALPMMKELIWLSGAEQAAEPYLGSALKAGQFANVLQDTAVFLNAQGLIDRVPGADVFRKAVSPGFIEQAISQAGGTK